MSSAKTESTPEKVDDLEAGNKASSKLKSHHAVDIDNALKHLYFPIYCLSLVTFVAGAYMVFMPHEFDVFRMICGNLLFVNGCMLLMNNDLIVTTIRMRVQICIMAHENARLSASAHREGKEVAKLQRISTGLNKLQTQFANDVQKALREVEKYAATTMTTVRLTAAQLVKWYLDANSDGVISRGPEQKQGEKLVSDFFRNCVDEFPQRHAAWQHALQNNSVYVALNGVPTEKFALLISALLAKKWKDGIMQTQVDRILNPQMDAAKVEAYQAQKQLQAIQAAEGKTFGVSETSAAYDIFGGYDEKVANFNMEDYSKGSELMVHQLFWLGAIISASVIAVVFGFVL